MGRKNKGNLLLEREREKSYEFQYFVHSVEQEKVFISILMHLYTVNMLLQHNCLIIKKTFTLRL